MAGVNLAGRIGLFAAMAAAIVWAMRVPAAATGFLNQDLARIVFFHLPCAFSSVIWLIAACVQSIRYLRTRNLEFDRRAAAAIDMTFLLMVLTLATGIVFSRAQWALWWHGDPRQTSFLIVTLMFGACLLLRSAFVDEAKRAANSAVYVLSMVLPILFLVFVFPRLEQVRSQSSHPTTTIPQGEMDATYRTVFLVIWALLMAYTVWSYRLRVRAAHLEQLVEDFDGELGDGGAASATGVVRPISISAKD